MSEMTARPPILQHPKNFLEELPLGIRLDEVQNAVGNDDIDRIARDQRMLHPQFLGELVGARETKRRRVIGRAFNSASSFSRSSARSWIRPLRNSTFA